MTQAAQIVSYDFGRHNEQLARGNVIRGNSWKKSRVVIMLPSGDRMSAKVALSHWNLIFPPNQAVHRMLMLGCEVGQAYSQAIEAVLANPELSQWEYILTIEHDNAPPPDGVLKLIKHMEDHPEYACIGGLYWCKGEGGCAHIWGDIKDPQVNYRPQMPIPNTVMECYGTSMGFNLWRMSMFKDERISRPLFETKASIQGVGTQDLAFWAKARPLGYRCAVATDVLVGHHDLEGTFGPPDTMW